MSVRREPPTAVNFSILVGAASVSLFCLWAAARTQGWLAPLPWAVLFSFSNNTIFSLLHEAEHRLFSRNRKLNDLAGSVAAAFFPTSLTFQRICHLGHHLRNRTDHEVFDLYYPSDNKLLKYAQFYSILLGPYWLSVPTGALLYMIEPRIFRVFKWIHDRAKSTDAAMLLPLINHPLAMRMRGEALFSLGAQLAIVQALHLDWRSYLLCYGLFALNWGSLQYADHFLSTRDIRDGAWNLRVPRALHWIYLNYHLHLAHHQHPDVPWIDLERHVDSGAARPSFGRIYLEMWKGPRPASAGPPRFLDEELKRVIERQGA
jgi:fatty acid desaturase